MLAVLERVLDRLQRAVSILTLGLLVETCTAGTSGKKFGSV